MQKQRLVTSVVVVLAVGVATAALSAARSRPLLVATGNELVEVG